MLINIFAKSFEQNSQTYLPPKAVRILHGVAKEFVRSSQVPSRDAKQLEMAQAVLHMRIYQQFGRSASDIMPVAGKMLSELFKKSATI